MLCAKFMPLFLLNKSTTVFHHLYSLCILEIIYIKNDDRLVLETPSYNSIIMSILFLCRKYKHSKLKNKTDREL